VKEKNEGVVKGEMLNADCATDIAVGGVVCALDSGQKRWVLRCLWATIAGRHNSVVGADTGGPGSTAIDASVDVSLAATLGGLKVL
jgi:hypothetical protein